MPLSSTPRVTWRTARSRLASEICCRRQPASALCGWLKSRQHEAVHLFDRNLLTATDTEIWELGRVEALTIFSKDIDFYDRALLYGPPPQIVHVGVGNCSNARLLEYLESHWNDIEHHLTSGCRLVALTAQRIEVFP
jgi:predicted nuclease of predicted toxin-antitoxin system